MLNPFEPGFFENPYAQYALVREQDPVHLSPIGVWALFRYDDVLRVLRDPSLSVEERHRPDPVPARSRHPGDARRAARGRLAHHAQPRPARPSPSAPARVEGVHPAHDRGAAARASRSSSTSISTAADPPVRRDRRPRVPAAVRRDLGDARHPRRPRSLPAPRMVGRGGQDLRSDPHARGVSSPRSTRSTTSSRTSNEVIAWKRENPSDDLLTALIAAEDEGDRLSEAELVEQVMLLYIAGHETTVNLIGNGTLALLRNRDQLELLAANDPSIDATFVDELLRYDSPVQMSRRITLAPYEIDGKTIEPGSMLMTCARRREPRSREVGTDRRRPRPAARRRARPHVVRRRLPLVPRRAPRPARRPGRDHARSCGRFPDDRARDRHARVERPHRAARPRRAAGDA